MRKFVVTQLLWNEKNIAHIRRHEIFPSEVEEVCQGDPIVFTGYKDRLFLVGKTAAGRMLSVILNPTDQAEVYYPVTAYDASERSKKDYEAEKGGEKAA